jgi:hypothetical protein
MPVAKDGNRPARRSGDGVAADDDVRMEAATNVARGGAGSLPTPILGTTAAGPSARVRPRVTGRWRRQGGQRRARHGRGCGAGDPLGLWKEDGRGGGRLLRNGKTPRHRGRRLWRLRADANLRPERRAVVVRRRAPEWARMEDPAVRPGVGTGKERRRIRVESGGFGIEAETAGVGESSPKGLNRQGG